MTDATVSPAQFWSGLRRLVVTGSVEVLLRAGVFGLVLSQYVFGGSLLPFTFSFALAYAVFALTAPMIYAISTRFPGPGLVLTCAVAICCSSIYTVRISPTIWVFIWGMDSLSSPRVQAKPSG